LTGADDAPCFNVPIFLKGMGDTQQETIDHPDGSPAQFAILYTIRASSGKRIIAGSRGILE
jgi:hypothetical protein